MKKFVTEDGSVTYYNEHVEDHYHTKSGAREEAFEKHAKALGVTSGSVIFDMFFGLGYNAAAALDVCKKATIYCFENDKEILEKVLELDEDFESFSIIKEFVTNFLERNETTYEKDGIKLIMLYGDAKQTIKTVPEKADFVFFDPFSPAKVPEQWTVDFFKDVFSKMKDDSKLSTYSYARKVREGLEKAGFSLEDGPIIRRRSPSLIAIKHNL